MNRWDQSVQGTNWMERMSSVETIAVEHRCVKLALAQKEAFCVVLAGCNLLQKATVTVPKN